MGKALQEIGAGRAARYAFGQLQATLLRSMLLPPQARVVLLRWFGAGVGRDTIVHPLTLINLYRRGLTGLRLGNDCFVGEECLFDLADGITLGDQVTLSARVMVLTHRNVGYRDHPLQADYPAMTGPVRLGSGCFVGAGATILAGVSVGARALVGAGALVHSDVAEGARVAGVPARPVDSGQDASP